MSYFKWKDWIIWQTQVYTLQRRQSGNIGWYTNLDIQKRHEKLILWKNYSPEEYPKYDNYDAIEVSKISNIPCDYEGVMGVPITYMDKANSEQFEIIGADEAEGTGFSQGLFIEGSKYKQCYANGARIYKRIFIRKKADA